MAEPSDVAEIGSEPRAGTIDAMAAHAIALLLEYRAPVAGVPGAHRSAPGLCAQEPDDGSGLRLGHIVRRHGAVGDPAKYDANQLGIRRRTPETPVAQVDIGDRVTFRAMAFDAIFHVQLFTVGQRWSCRRCLTEGGCEDQNGEHGASYAIILAEGAHMSIRKIVAAGGLILLLANALAHANVVRIEITKTEPAGPSHEKISGKAYGELDPADPKNAVITDIELAPRNARGKVEYVATFSLVKPTDMARASGVLLYTVVNRGGGVAAANADGHVTLVSGWQGDLIPTDGNQTLAVPVAKNRDGSKITGPLIVRFTDVSGPDAPLTIPRDRPSPYPPASLDTTKATLTSAAAETPTGVKSGVVTIPSSEWAFADCSAAPFPGTPNPSRICLKGGFDAARLYELRYTVADPLVLGIGLAATRDIGAFFKYEQRDSVGTPNPVAGRITAAISEGSSQSGTFLRLSLLLGFNQDERGRIVWDGMNPHIAGRLTDLNRRFALPGGAVSLYELGHEGPAWWTVWRDDPRGRPEASLLDRCRATNTCPKIMETFGSAEFWGLRMSFNLVGTNAKRDIPIPDNVRRYYFPSVTHGGGAGGFVATAVPSPDSACVLAANPAPVAPMRAALQKRLVAWVTQGTAMPPSKYPTLADGTLVKNTSDGRQIPLLDYDLGPQFRYGDQSGVLTKHPVIKGELPQLVVKVDADGNEVAGIKSPLLAAPLGTYTGWNIRASGIFKGQSCGNSGGFKPFAKTKAERLASGDSRLSLEERYKDHETYVRLVTNAANELVRDGFLLQADAENMVRQAERSNVLK